MKTIDQIVIENIISRRERLGLKQKELAEKANLTAIAWNKIEKGKRPPGRATIKAVAEALGCEEAELYQDASIASRPPPHGNLTYADAGAILEKIASLSPSQQKVIFALLWKNPALVRGISPVADQVVRILSETP